MATPEQAGCCPPSAVGAVASPAGYVKLGGDMDVGGGVSCYVVEPAGGAAPGRAVLVFHDIFGVDSARTRQICDLVASWGYLVVMPDLFKGGALDQTHAEAPGVGKLRMLLPAFGVLRGNQWVKHGVREKILEWVLPYLRNRRGCERIGTLCFCWGCYPMTHLLSMDLPQFKCGVGMHPSLIVFLALFYRNREELVSKCKVPLLYCSAADDPSDVKPGGMAEQALKTAGNTNSVFKLYPKMIHGWVNRGNLADAQVKADYDDAIQLMQQHFAKYL
jgi:dienelactone hydrolase